MCALCCRVYIGCSEHVLSLHGSCMDTTARRPMGNFPCCKSTNPADADGDKLYKIVRFCIYSFCHLQHRKGGMQGAIEFFKNCFFHFEDFSQVPQTTAGIGLSMLFSIRLSVCPAGRPCCSGVTLTLTCRLQ